MTKSPSGAVPPLQFAAAFLAALLAGTLCVVPASVNAAEPPPKATITVKPSGIRPTSKKPQNGFPAGYRQILDRLVEPFIDAGDVVGMVVGLAVGTEHAVIGYGHFSQEKQQAPDANTLFEIGSISKTFTALLLADMVEREMVRLDDPVQKLLPESVQVPKRGNVPITLLDLATHTSGLPRMPGNWKPARSGDPYFDYTKEMLFEYLTRAANPGLLRSLATVIEGNPERKYAYSNLGAGLLGQALALRASMSYETLLTERITRPLGMKNTCITLSTKQRRRFSPGYNADGVPVSSWNWERSSLAGAGGIRSSATDMLRYLSANMGATKTCLRAAMDATHQPQHRINETLSIGLGWHINTKRDFIWHNGRTGGYCSMALFDEARRLGVVVLANTSSDVIDKLGISALRVLRGQSPPPVRQRHTISLGEDLLQKYVGTYVALAFGRMTITLEGTQLMAQITGQEKIRIYPESETEFFYRVVDAQISFDEDQQGRVTRLILHQHGHDIPAVRLPAMHQE